ncbi:MAG: hypothetical protein ABFC98_05165, partial [Candidatus Cloacimonas sp.]
KLFFPQKLHFIALPPTEFFNPSKHFGDDINTLTVFSPKTISLSCLLAMVAMRCSILGFCPTLPPYLQHS